MLSSQLSFSHRVGHTVVVAWQRVHLMPSPFLHGGEGSSFPHLVPPNDTVHSDSGVVIGLSG